MKRIGLFAGMLAVAVVVSSVTAHANTIIDLTTAGSSNLPAGTTAALGGNFLVQQISPQSTGTGVIDSFLRVDATGNANTEQGFNTDLHSVLDNVGGVFTRPLLLSAVPIVTINGIAYRQFLLDINQTNSVPNNFLSLNQIQLFQSSGDPTAFNAGGLTGATATTAPQIGTSAFTGVTSTEVFRMNNSSNTNPLEIQLNFDLNPGSGAGDMFLYVPNADFSSNATNVIFYTQFGQPPGAFATNDGFEEWAVLEAGPVVPEPGSLVLLGTGLAALGLIKRKQILK